MTMCVPCRASCLLFLRNLESLTWEMCTLFNDHTVSLKNHQGSGGEEEGKMNIGYDPTLAGST